MLNECSAEPTGLVAGAIGPFSTPWLERRYKTKTAAADGVRHAVVFHISGPELTMAAAVWDTETE